MSSGPSTNPRALNYQDRATAALPPLTANQNDRGMAGFLSLGCFVLFVLVCVVTMLRLKYVVDPNAPWSGLGELFATACSGLILLPLGLLAGIVGLTQPSGRRGAAVVGLILNGSVIGLTLARRFVFL